MTQPPRRLAWSLALLIVVAGITAGPVSVRASAPSPATTADAVRTALFDAQSALLDDAAATAQSRTADAVAAAQPLLVALPANSPATGRLTAGLTAATDAASAGNDVALAAARGEIATAILLGAHDATLAAIAAGDTAGASSWLLVREFRPSTKFSRPGADATLALRGLAGGSVTPDAATAAVEADLLDTYQAKLEEALSAAENASTNVFSSRLAETTAQAAGYWAILAQSYERQFGPDARAAADAAFAQLAAAGLGADTSALEAARTRAVDLVESFRAAPLSGEEQARRAGQLLLYLSLVPVEYGRGVKQGQVVLDIEVQEAQTFLDGARAAFNDLRLPLTERDSAQTAAVADLLAGLDASLKAAAIHQYVAAPSDVESASADAAAKLKAMFPQDWERAGGAADFDVVASLLDQMEKAIAAKQYKQAESARLEAYAIYDAGPEKRLLAFSPSLARKIERLFWQGDGDHEGLADALAAHAGSGDIRPTRLALDAALTEAQQTLGTGHPATGAVVFNAATIVFREGLEAILILASLLASMIGVNRQYKKPLVLGSLGALAASALLFVLARSVLLSLNRYGEKVEAVVSVVAIGVLLLVLNWFFHKVYWTRWIAKHHNRRRAIIGGAAGQVIGLGVLGFTSVFREGAETVVFLQALVLDAGTWVVFEGTLLGLVAVLIVGALTFALQAKLPHKKMLIVTGVMISAVLVTMVGNTVHVLQVVGWAPIAPIGDVELPYWLSVWFGVYATWQGVIAQVAAGVFVVGSYYVAEHAHERRLTSKLRRFATATS